MNKNDVLKEIFELEDISERIKACPRITEIGLLVALSKPIYDLNYELNVANATLSKYIKILFPDRPISARKIDNWLLKKYMLKQCKNCLEVKPEEEFSRNASRSDGLNTHCKLCKTANEKEYQKEYQKRRKLLVIYRVPAWADIDKIKEIYAKCPKGYHVDHIVPLQGTLVSGLHVEYNLQYLLAEDNLSKGNKFEIL